MALRAYASLARIMHISRSVPTASGVAWPSGVGTNPGGSTAASAAAMSSAAWEPSREDGRDGGDADADTDAGPGRPSGSGTPTLGLDSSSGDSTVDVVGGVDDGSGWEHGTDDDNDDDDDGGSGASCGDTVGRSTAGSRPS